MLSQLVCWSCRAESEKITPPKSVKCCLSRLLKLTSEKDGSDPKNKVLSEEWKGLHIPSFVFPSPNKRFLQLS